MALEFSWMDFLTVIIIAFAIVMVVAGLFTTYFGSGRGRTIGLLILVVGLVVGAIWIYLTANSGISPFCDVHLWDVLWRALVDILGFVIGALIAVGIFLVGVMKS